MISASNPLMHKTRIFGKNNLIDIIHQAIIDLTFPQQQDNIIQLLYRTLAYLDDKLQPNELQEVVTLITTCLSKFETIPKEIFKTIYQNIYLNSNRLISFAILLEQNPEKLIPFKKSHEFLMETSKQLYQNVQQSAAEWTISKITIPQIYKTRFLSSILLSVFPTAKVVAFFYPYVLSQKDLLKKHKIALLQNVNKPELIQLIPATFFLEKSLFPIVQELFEPSNIALILSNMNRRALIDNFAFLNEHFRNPADSVIFTAFFDQCVRYNFVFDWIRSDDFFTNWTASMIKDEYWPYFAANQVILPNRLSSNLTKFPDDPSILNVLPSFEYIPCHYLIKYLSKIDDISMIESIAKNATFYDYQFDLCSEISFWTHIYSVISNSLQKISSSLLDLLVELFSSNVDANQMYEYFDKMIFSNFESPNGYHFLNHLLNNLSAEYKSVFMKNYDVLIEKVLSLHVPPPATFCILFDSVFLQTLHSKETTKHLLPDAYSPGSKKTMPKKLNKSNQQSILTFLQTKDVNSLLNSLQDFSSPQDKKFNSEFNSFLSQILHFVQSKEISTAELTEDIVLPFVVIACYLNDHLDGIARFDSDIGNILLDKLNGPKYDQFDISLINSLLTFKDYLFDKSVFPVTIAFEILDIFINQFLDQTYQADQSILLNTFCYSPPNGDALSKSLHQKNGLHLFEFFLQNPTLSKNMGESKLNLAYLNQDRLRKLINRYITTSRSLGENIFPLFLFINENCIFSQKYAANLSLYDQCMNDFVKHLSGHFIYYHLFNHHNIDKLINEIISRNDNLDGYLALLFANLMSDSTIAKYYALSVLEKVSKYHSVSPKDLSKSSVEFGAYQKDFISAIHSHYEVGEDSIIYRNFQKDKDFSSILDFYSTSFITKLFTILDISKSYQAMYCLNKLALTFPFLFIRSKYSTYEMFRSIVSLLSNFSLLFEKQNVHDEIEMVCLMALSFLHSISHCPYILDHLLAFIMEEFLDFSVSQILAITILLNSFINTPNVKNAFLFHSIPSFLAIAFDLLNRSLPKEIQQIYTDNIINLLNAFISYTKLEDDEQKRISYFVRNREKITSHFFNNYLTLTSDEDLSSDAPLAPLNFHLSVSDIERDILYKPINWIALKKAVHINVISSTISLLGSTPISCDNSISTENVSPSRVIHSREWIFRYITRDFIDCSFLRITPNATLFHLEIHSRSSDNEAIAIQIPVKVLIPLFDKIVNDASLEKLLLAQALGTNSKSEILPIIKQYISDNINDIDKLFSLLNYLGEYYFANEIILEIIKEIICLVLTPEYRGNKSHTDKLISLIIKYSHFPPQSSHLLAFYIINRNYQDIEFNKVTRICLNLEEYSLLPIMPVINKLLENEKWLNNAGSDAILDLIKRFPSLIPTIKTHLPKILEKLSKSSYLSTSDIETFITLFNTLTPPKKESHLEEEETVDLSFTESVRCSRLFSQTNTRFHESYVIQKIPQSVYNENPEFWTLYEQCSEFINRILTIDESYMLKFSFIQMLPQVLNFDKRLEKFHEATRQMKIDGRQISFTVDRHNILYDSFNALNHLSTEQWLSHFKVKFLHENGIDCGGLTKEWFTLITEAIFNPNFGLFVLSANNTYQPQPLSDKINDNHIEYFRFAGKIVARCLIQELCINAHFTPSFRRQLLNHNIRLKDYEDIDKNIYLSMKTILENDVEPMYLTFTTIDDEFGDKKVVPLIEDGENIDVTNNNKNEYVSLYINYHLKKSINAQISAFCEGFYSLIPLENISYFSQSELDFILCGHSQIDIEDMKKHVVYSSPYHKDHATIIMFYEVISNWSQEDLTKLILFVTGSSKIPINGFKGYEETGNSFHITKKSDPQSLCVAHTCFNTLDLPSYSSAEEMNEKILYAINECQEFGIS